MSASGSSGTSMWVVSAHFNGRRHDALALAHAGGIEVVANLPADQLGIIGQGIERERDGEGLLALQRPVGGAQRKAVQAAPVQ